MLRVRSHRAFQCMAIVHQVRLTSSTPWRPQGLSEAPEIPRSKSIRGFSYVNGDRPMGPRGSAMLQKMREKMDHKWYKIEPVKASLVLIFFILCYFVGKLEGNVYVSGLPS